MCSYFVRKWGNLVCSMRESHCKGQSWTRCSVYGTLLGCGAMADVLHYWVSFAFGGWPKADRELCIVFLASSRAFFPFSHLHVINFTFQSFRISICIYYYATEGRGSLQMTSYLYHWQKKQKQNKIRKIYFWSYIYDAAWQINSITSRPEERNFWSLVVQRVAGWQQGEQAVACVRRSVL